VVVAVVVKGLVVVAGVGVTGMRVVVATVRRRPS
jgi:hypothetical protein